MGVTPDRQHQLALFEILENVVIYLVDMMDLLVIVDWSSRFAFDDLCVVFHARFVFESIRDKGVLAQVYGQACRTCNLHLEIHLLPDQFFRFFN